VSNLALATATATSNGASTYAVTAGQVSDTLLKRLASHGVGLIRLVTNPAPLLTDDALAREASIAQVLMVVDAMRVAGLHVIVDFHNWTPGDPAKQSAAMVNDVAQRARLLRALVEMAAQLKRKPAGSVGLELLNEPACKLMTDVQWPELQAEFYRSLRREAPVLPLVLKGCNDGSSDLMRLDVEAYRKDPNAIFSFHFYEPFIFTHQATYYRGSSFKRVPFPATRERLDTDKVVRLADYFATSTAQINQDSVTELQAYLGGGRGEDWYGRKIKQVVAWADSEGIAHRRIFLGEYGTTLQPGPDAQKIWPDLLRWLGMVSAEAQRDGVAYCLWTSIRPNGLLVDPQTGFVRPDVMTAIAWEAPK
jgi:endoglucanase